MASTASARLIVDSAALARALARLAHEIAEGNAGVIRDGGEVILLGIPTRGVPLAARLTRFLTDLGVRAQAGTLDPSARRDDDVPSRAAAETELPSAITDRVVVLVDDVLYTGRTIRAALDELITLGRPAAVRLAVMVDRGHRELPIRPDYVGKNLPTSHTERVSVRLAETDEVAEGIWLEQAPQ